MQSFCIIVQKLCDKILYKGGLFMEHNMKLQPALYYAMLNGPKRIEIRLNDEKRQQIKIGDTIEFLKEPDLEESFKTRVVDLLHYESFDDMLEDIDISLLAGKDMTKEELLTALEQFYSKEKQAKYGVLGIKIELI